MVDYHDTTDRFAGANKRIYETHVCRGGGDWEPLRDDSNPRTLRDGLASLSWWRREMPGRELRLVRYWVRRDERGMIVASGKAEVVRD